MEAPGTRSRCLPWQTSVPFDEFLGNHRSDGLFLRRSVDETGDVLNAFGETVKGDWKPARAWLKRELNANTGRWMKAGAAGRGQDDANFLTNRPKVNAWTLPAGVRCASLTLSASSNSDPSKAATWGGSYRCTGSPLHFAGPSTPNVAMIAVPPTLSVLRRCATYAPRSSFAVRKWKTARSCQTSTEGACHSPVTSASIQVTRAACAPSLLRVRARAADDTSRTVRHVSPRSRR